MHRLARYGVCWVLAAALAGCSQTTPGAAIRTTSEGTSRSSLTPAMAATATLPFLWYQGQPVVSSFADIQVLQNEGYTVGFSETTATPIWACYRLFAVGDVETSRPDVNFSMDDRISIPLKHSSYSNSGYDRGHMAPSSGIGRCYGDDPQLGTFIVTNICPQHPGLNQRAWERFEHKEAMDYAERLGEVWVTTGPIFEGPCMELAKDVRVPSAFYKIVAAEIDGKPEMLAIVMNNQRTEDSLISDYITTVDVIEQRTQIDFFHDLPDDVESAAESDSTPHTAWTTGWELRPVFPGTPRSESTRACD